MQGLSLSLSLSLFVCLFCCFILFSNSLDLKKKKKKEELEAMKFRFFPGRLEVYAQQGIEERGLAGTSLTD